MIITLKNADFSKLNIGTLSTWRITRSLGTGATYDGVTSVDKGLPFSATVTIAEGYELGASGVVVTMGGESISSFVINGNVITITIAAVTGNVVIKVPTINTATGEEEEPEVPEIPNKYTLNVENIPFSTRYTIDDPYTDSIFEVTTDRWLSAAASGTTPAGSYELTTFPLNNTEYLLCRIDLTAFKNKGYTTITFNPGDGAAGVTYRIWTYSTDFEDTWITSVPRQTMENSTTIDITNKTILYVGIRRFKDGDSIPLTYYHGKTFEVVFS